MSWIGGSSPRSAINLMGLRLLPDGDSAFTDGFSVVVKIEIPLMPDSLGFSSLACPSRDPQRNCRKANSTHDEDHSGDDHSGGGADHVAYLV